MKLHIKDWYLCTVFLWPVCGFENVVYNVWNEVAIFIFASI